MPEIIVRKPKDCAENQLVGLIELADKSGEVDRHSLESGIRARARDLLWVEDEQDILAMAVLKLPNRGYRHGVFEKSMTVKRSEEYPLELGYIYVEDAMRGQGVATALTERALCLANGKGIFATTREQNKKIQYVLEKTGFSRAGKPYPSERGDFNLLLHVHLTSAR